jgi:hypothetical protein
VAKSEIHLLYGLVSHQGGGEIQFTITIPVWLVRIIIQPVLLYRRLRYGYSFCRIPLTQGKFAIVDPDDYFWLSKRKWYAVKGALTFYAVGTVFKEGKGHRLHMHRDVLNVAEGMVVDHINHNGLDNRKANLRPATAAQNAWSAARRRGPSGYKGVSFDKKRRLWRASIAYCGKREFLGHFSDKREAAKAYDRAAIKYHGQFASLNFPDLATEGTETTEK